MLVLSNYGSKRRLVPHHNQRPIDLPDLFPFYGLRVKPLERLAFESERFVRRFETAGTSAWVIRVWKL
jgi:hypothetical protein